MSNKWIPFTEDYKKWSYEVLLPDGTILKNGWPNAGTMHAGGNVYKPSDGIKVRLQKDIYEPATPEPGGTREGEKSE